jgi:hypothetical protein
MLLSLLRLVFLLKHLEIDVGRSFPAPAILFQQLIALSYLLP